MAKNGNGNGKGMIGSAIGAAVIGFGANALADVLHIPYADEQSQYSGGMTNIQAFGNIVAFGLGALGFASLVAKKPVFGFTKDDLAKGVGLGGGIAIYNSWGKDVLNIS